MHAHICGLDEAFGRQDRGDGGRHIVAGVLGRSSVTGTPSLRRCPVASASNFSPPPAPSSAPAHPHTLTVSRPCLPAAGINHRRFTYHRVFFIVGVRGADCQKGGCKPACVSNTSKPTDMAPGPGLLKLAQANTRVQASLSRGCLGWWSECKRLLWNISMKFHKVKCNVMYNKRHQRQKLENSIKPLRDSSLASSMAWW